MNRKTKIVILDSSYSQQKDCFTEMFYSESFYDMVVNQPIERVANFLTQTKRFGAMDKSVKKYLRSKKHPKIDAFLDFVKKNPDYRTPKVSFFLTETFIDIYNDLDPDSFIKFLRKNQKYVGKIDSEIADHLKTLGLKGMDSFLLKARTNSIFV